MHEAGRVFSQEVYDRTDLDGIVYLSRLTSEDCVAIYDRGVWKLKADPVVPMEQLAALVPALQSLSVELI